MSRLEPTPASICHHVEAAGGELTEYVRKKGNKKNTWYIEARDEVGFRIITRIPQDYEWLEHATCLQMCLTIDGLAVSRFCLTKEFIRAGLVPVEGHTTLVVDRAQLRVLGPRKTFKVVRAKMVFSPVTEHLVSMMESPPHAKGRIGEIQVDTWQCVHDPDRPNAASEPNLNIRRIMTTEEVVQNATHLIAYQEVKQNPGITRERRTGMSAADAKLTNNKCKRLTNVTRAKFLYRSKEMIDGLKCTEAKCICSAEREYLAQSPAVIANTQTSSRPCTTEPGVSELEVSNAPECQLLDSHANLSRNAAMN